MSLTISINLNTHTAPPLFYPSSFFSLPYNTPTKQHHTYYKTKQQRKTLALRSCCCGQESFGSEVLGGKTIVPKELEFSDDDDDVDDEEEEEEEKADEDESESKNKVQLTKPRLVSWEDRILEDTVPIVGFIRMVLHSGRYGCGERLSPEHERTILDRVLPYHPQYKEKIGCGIEYITIGYHPEFVQSRCLFIVRKDGRCVDFSYWKCIKAFINKKYPLYAHKFILKHFKKRGRYG